MMPKQKMAMRNWQMNWPKSFLKRWNGQSLDAVVQDNKNIPSRLSNELNGT